MKKIVLVLLVCVFMFSLAITAVAKVNISFWNYPSIIIEGLEPGVYEQRVIDEFEKLYPEVNIDLEIIPYTSGTEKLNFNIISGTPPDIISDTLFRVGTYGNNGLLVPFELTEDEKNDIFPFIIEASSYRGNMNYYPMGIAVQGLVINKALAREAGALDLLPLDRPDRSWTVDEYKAFITKVATTLPGVYGQAMSLGDATGHQFTIMLMMQGFGAVPFVLENDKWECTLNSPEAVEGLEYYLDIYNTTPGALPKGVESLSAGDAGNLFLTSKAAVGFSGITYIVKALGGDAALAALDLSMFPMPSKEGVSNSTILGWCGFGVFDNHDADRAKYAQMFVRYFCENAPDIMKSIGNTSPVKKSTPVPFQEYKDNVEIQYYQTEFAQFGKDFGALCPVYQAFKGVFYQTMQGVFTGELTAKEGLDEVVSKTNKLLDEFYAK